MADDPLARDIDVVARLEREALEQRSAGERMSDAIVGAVATMTFAAAQLVWIGFWILVNSGLVPGVTPFDPFPFGVLALLVSTEGVILVLFILIRQQRMMRQADKRAHLHLQVSVLAEREATKTLQLLEAVNRHLGLGKPDAESRALAGDTKLDDLADTLHRELPGPNG